MSTPVAAAVRALPLLALPVIPARYINLLLLLRRSSLSRVWIPLSPASSFPQVEAYVRGVMAGHDSSHDFSHVDRVRKTALRLAAEEVRSGGGVACTWLEFCARTHPQGIIDVEVVELGALLHDVFDYKYSGACGRGRGCVAAARCDPAVSLGCAGSDTASGEAAEKILTEHVRGVCLCLKDRVCLCVCVLRMHVLMCVQDVAADRIKAVQAIISGVSFKDELAMVCVYV